MAQERAQSQGGILVLRNEDLDPDRCRAEYVTDLMEDLRWFGFSWQEGPDCGGPCGPYVQSARRAFYVAAFEQLWQAGLIYPCHCSRRDVQQATQAPHAADDEPIYPGVCRSDRELSKIAAGLRPVAQARSKGQSLAAPVKVNWRFRVPDGEPIEFVDGGLGPQRFVAGKDFGDFVVWRHDDVPAYQLAVVVDDTAMGMTEVVRGADLLVSTARQWLIYRALGRTPPAFFHCPLMTDEKGVRLAKRHDALSLRTLRLAGRRPKELREEWG
jgi:glutamyl-tRNA synthetase